jgi:hypothetical protein
MCATCPFRPGSPYEYLRQDLSESALNEGSRICHSTGTSGIFGRTGKKDLICRGARDFQLQVFHGIGFLPAPTDQAWDAKKKELGLK